MESYFLLQRTTVHRVCSGMYYSEKDADFTCKAVTFYTDFTLSYPPAALSSQQKTLKAKIYMKKNVMTFLFLISALVVLAQGNTYTVTGVVQSTTGEPLLGANVSFTDSKQAERMYGMATDANGGFSVSVPHGTYRLSISYLGYTKYETNVEVKNQVHLPVIALSEDAQVMDAVVITAKTVTYNASGYIAEISKNPLYREEDMTSILRLTPGTNATHDKIQVYGQTVSKVYLNGRVLKLSGEQLMNYLSSLEGKNIKQMEVIAASGVEEDANTMGSSIIKITTINPEAGGTLNTGGIFIFGKGRYAYLPRVDVNWKLGKKWATYFNGSVATNQRTDGTMTETHFYDTDRWMSSESGGKKKAIRNYNATWGLSYDMDAHNLFSFEASYYNSLNEFSTHDITRQQTNGVYETKAEGNIGREYDSWRSDFSLIYTHLFNNQADLTIQADRVEKHQAVTEDSRYTYTAGNETANQLLSDEKNLVYTVRADYTLPVKKGKGTFKAGVKYANISDKQDTDYAYFLNSQKDNESSYLDLYDYSEEVYAAYAKYAFKTGKFDFNAGLRMEHALLSPKSSSNPERNWESTHTDWAPELGINYALNKEKGHNIALQYNRSISRPFFGFLNPRVERSSEYYYYTGNPMLGPTVMDNYSLRGTFFNRYTLAFNHSYTNDGIQYLPENVDGVIYSSPQTGMKNARYSIYADVPVKLKQWGQVNFSATYRYSEDSYREDSNHSDSWTFGMNGMFKLPYDISLSFSASASTPSKSLYGETRERVLADIRLNKSFLKRSLNVSLSFNDIFNSMGSRTLEHHYNSHYQLTKGTESNFNVFINVRYTLRWGQKSNVRKAGSGNLEESSRLN